MHCRNRNLCGRTIVNSRTKFIEPAIVVSSEPFKECDSQGLTCVCPVRELMTIKVINAGGNYYVFENVEWLV